MVSFKENPTVAVIGLGYVGLPLAVELSKFFDVIGYDVNEKRIHGLKLGDDITMEVSNQAILDSDRLFFSHDKTAIKSADIYIVTVPTPINEHKRPNLTP